MVSSVHCCRVAAMDFDILFVCCNRVPRSWRLGRVHIVARVVFRLNVEARELDRRGGRTGGDRDLRGEHGIVADCEGQSAVKRSDWRV